MKAIFAVVASLLIATSCFVVAGAAPQSSMVTPTASKPIVVERRPQLTQSDQMLLDEYRLADKVETRVIGNLKVYGAVLGLALAFIGFLGFHVLVDSLTRRFEKTAKEDLEAIRTRTQTALVDLELAVREGQRTSTLASEQAARLRLRHAELEDLATKYQALHSEVESISQRVERALSAAAESQEKVAGFGVALTNTFAGSPALFSSSFLWEREGTIEGKNFGTVPGKLLLSFHSRFVPAPGEKASGEKTGTFEVAGDYIKEWTDTSIKFHMPAQATRTVKEFRDRQEELWKRNDPDRKGDRSLGYEFVVERADGVKGTH